MSLRGSLSAAAALALGCLAACGDSGDGVGAGGSGAGSNGGAPDGGSSNEGAGFADGGSGGGSTVNRGCSADLQNVVDESGTVIEQCPPDQGCLEGACVPACDAAAAASGSIGCGFFAPDPPFVSNETSSAIEGPCYAAFVANTWSRPARLSVSRGGQQLDVSAFARIPSGVGNSTSYSPLPADGLPPGQVAVLFLSHKPGVTHPLGGSLECPVSPAVLADAAVHNSGRGAAFSIQSDTPILAYDILPYGGARSFLPSASLLFPHTAWGDNYVAQAPQGGGGGQPWIMLVGQADATTVQLVSPTGLPGGNGVPAIPANTLTEVTIGAGEMVQWMGADPNGVVFQSSAPIGVFSGDTYLRVATQTSPSAGGQDSAHQQLPPVGALGTSYVAGGVVTRISSLQPESVLYQVLGVVDGTQLTYDPPIPGAPTTLTVGQVVRFETTNLFQVSSQDADHPFMLTQYMGGTVGLDRPGCGPTPPFGGLSCGLGDEEWVTLMPPGQFLQRYVFFVDPTYAASNLVVVREAGADGSFAPVNVACLGEVGGWQTVGAGNKYQVAHVDLFRSFVASSPGCDTSRHEINSDGRFGVMVWGTDYYASYGYPAGGNVGTINEVVVVPEVPE